MDLKYFYEDQDLIVVEKPAGISSQAQASYREDMVSLLTKHLLASSNTSKPYLAVVHRLDQPVRGIMVFAKNKKTAASLSSQVQHNSSPSMEKIYRATVAGSLPLSSWQSLSDYIFFDKKNKISKVVEKDHKDAKLALLSYRCLANRDSAWGPVSDLEIQLKTGRHHQIRLQLSHLGHPIIGDTRYGTIRAPLQLVAYKLSFIHPRTGKLMTFQLED